MWTLVIYREYDENGKHFLRAVTLGIDLEWPLKQKKCWQYVYFAKNLA